MSNINVPSISEIYSKEEKIILSDDFLINLSQRRRKKYDADKKFLDNSKVVDIDINKICKLPDGRIRFFVKGIKFECLFHYGNNEKLFVILNGARAIVNSKKRELPAFSRWSWYPYANYSWLNIEDPMYYKYEDLSLGWYYGSEEINYREYVAIIAKKVSEFLEIKKEDVVFYGSSGGGTAAIHSAAEFGSGVAVSINGQINFEYSHKDIKEFIEHTGIDMYKKDKYDRNDICKIIKNSVNTKFILIENCRSKWDFNDHLKYLCKKLEIKPCYGVSKHNNIYTYLYEAWGENPHKSFEDRNLFFAIDFLITLASVNADVEQYQSLYLLFNEFWYDLYEIKNSKLFPKEFSELQISLIKSNVLNLNVMREILNIEEIEIISGNDKYKNYEFRKFSANTTYYISIECVLSMNVESLDIGLFDYTKKNFINKQRVQINNKIEYAFSIGASNTIITNNLAFCIFVGKHGETQGKEIKIKGLVIKTY